MNNIITLPKLADLLSKATGVSTAEAEKFVIDFTGLIAEGLANDGVVKVKGLGSFSRVESGGKYKIAFTPEREMAEYINSPFAFFDSVELSDGVSADMLESRSEESEPKEEPETETVAETAVETEIEEPVEPEVPETEEELPEPEERVEAPTEEEAIETSETPEDTPEVQEEPVTAPLTSRMSVQPGADTQEDATDYDYSDETYADTDDQKPNLWFWLSITFILGLLIGFGVGYFCHDPIAARTYNQVQEEYDLTDGSEYEEELPSEETEEPTDTLQTTQPESEATPTESTQVSEPTAVAPASEPVQDPVDTKPKQTAENTPVYDTVRANYTLTGMARQHYGNEYYWVYIYEENRDKISNPNNVRAGIKLRIPPKEKYATAANESENLRIAKEKARALLQKYSR